MSVEFAPQPGGDFPESTSIPTGWPVRVNVLPVLPFRQRLSISGHIILPSCHLETASDFFRSGQVSKVKNQRMCTPASNFRKPSQLLDAKRIY